MEALVSASLGVMGSLLQKLDKLLLEASKDNPASTRWHPKRIVAGMQLLREDLEEISTYLEDLSEVEDPPPTAKCWMKQVRELSYDMDDYINSRSATIRAKSSFKMNRVEIKCFPKKRAQHKGMAQIISMFRIRAQQAIERHEWYKLDCRTFRRRYAPMGPMLPTPYEEGAHLAFDGRTSEFIDSLSKDADEQLKVVSILGCGGIGKTTLVRVLYEKLRGQFDCQAFIRMTRKPSTKTVLHDILTQVQRQEDHDDLQDLDLMDKIRNHLQEKRYLIIIDDLWDASVWDIISHAFPEGSQSSRIISSTEIEDVARSCCCYQSENVFEMEPLCHDHSRKIFFNRLCCAENEFPREFKEVSSKIVELCSGLPLATISIASLLASHPLILMEQWTDICDSLSSVLRISSSSEGMRLVLNFSYNNLSHHLKTCLLYLNMYPEGCTVCKDDLVKQWVAEGFIDAAEGRDMEKVAESFFDELIGRRFLQPAYVKYNDELVCCAVHDMVRDLIAYKSVEDNFIIIVDCDQKNVELCDKVHRLSLYFGDAKYAKIPGNIRMSRVRSLTFFGLFSCMPSIAEFKLLRVLNLQLSGHHGQDILDLTGISELFHLRYLKVASDACIELPKHMGRLQYLVTLDLLDTKVTSVPWDIIHLPCLLHLRLPFVTNLIASVHSMRTSSLHSLRKLTNLQDLRLNCSTLPPVHLLEALGSLLSGHGSLKTLSLVPGPSHKNTALHPSSEVTVSWDGFTPPLLLVRFEWFPHSFTFSKVPQWIKELGNLCILKIAVRELVRDGVDILRGLPALTTLSLYVQAAPVERIVFDRAGFSVLKYFKFRCSAIPWLKFETDAVPNLRKLKLGFNAHRVDQQGYAPIHIEHLSGLKEISVKIWGAGADEVSVMTAGITNHTSNPRVNVQLVDPETEEEGEDLIMEEDPGGCCVTEDADSRGEMKQADIGNATTSESYPDPPISGTRGGKGSSSSSHATNSSAQSLSQAAMESATGALGTLLPKLGQLLKGEYNMQKGVKENIEFLKRELKSIHAALRAVGEVPPEQLKEQVRIWAQEARELSYYMEDVVDTFLVRVEGPDPPSKRSTKRFFKKMFKMVSKTRRQIAEKTKDIKERVKEVAECRDRYKVDAISPAKITIDPRITALYAKATDLVGIDEAREEVITLLTEGDNMSTQQQRIVSIVGFGGLGKTTLARAVLDKIKVRFDCSAFVSVSQNLNMKKFFMDILYELDKNKYQNIHSTQRDETQLIDLVREFLKNKRYFIIVDDIWSISHWKKIKYAFPDHNDGCGIITTTRIATVAEYIGGFYKMRTLSLDNSRILLYGRVFGNEDNDKCLNKQLAEVSDRILKKCGGVPLGIITIASMLASKKRDKIEWDHVCNSIGTGTEKNSLDVEDMRRILSMSYCDMPPHLRICLLYLSVFPEDHVIYKDRLIWKWIAESFIQCEEEGVTQYETGESYLNELVNRSMVQPIYDDDDDSSTIQACRVHAMVLDLICSLSSEENFVTILNDMHLISSPEKIRRLSLQNGKTDHNMPGVSTSMKQLRSFIAFGSSIDLMPTLQSFRVLRVLDLEDCDLSQGYSLKYLGNLLHLRYLGLNDTKIDQLPEELGNLQFLQTLDVHNWQLRSLPMTIVQLKHLMRLSIRECTTVPKGIGSLTSLEELSCVDVRHDSCTIEELSHLTELKVLDIKCLINWKGSSNKSLVEWLNKLEKIRSLYIWFRSDGWNLDGWVYGDPRRLRTLDLVGRSPVFSTLPAWLNPSRVPCLSWLNIYVREVQQEGLKILGRLPALRCLMLRLGILGRFVVGAGSFPCLVHCRLWGYEEPVVLFQQGAMPKLTSLVLGIHVRETREIHGGFDLGLGNLPSLQDVDVWFQPGGASEEEVEEAKAAVRHAIQIHPNHPNLRVDGVKIWVVNQGLTKTNVRCIIDRRRQFKLKLIAPFAKIKMLRSGH